MIRVGRSVSWPTRRDTSQDYICREKVASSPTCIIFRLLGPGFGEKVLDHVLLETFSLQIGKLHFHAFRWKPFPYKLGSDLEAFLGKRSQ